MKSDKSIIVLLIIVMFFWALCYPLILLGLKYSPHISFAAMRATAAGAILLLIATFLGKKHPKDLIMWLYLLLIGIGATTLGFYGMFHASEFLKPGLATVVTNTQPLLTAVFASIFLQEKISNKGKFGLFLGFVGVLIIVHSSWLENDSNIAGLSGFFYLSISVLGLSLSNILIKKIIGKIDVLIAMGWQLLLGGLILWVVALSTENMSDVVWSNDFIVSLTGLVILGTVLVYWLWFSILEKITLSYANSYAYLVPVFGISMGVIFFQEIINLQTFVGIVIIIFGITINMKAKRSNNI